MDQTTTDSYSADYFFWLMLFMFCLFICAQLAFASYYADAFRARSMLPHTEPDYPPAANDPSAPLLRPSDNGYCLVNIPQGEFQRCMPEPDKGRGRSYVVITGSPPC